MIHQKDGGQVGQTISHYPALRDLPFFGFRNRAGFQEAKLESGTARRDKILEKLGEARPRQTHIWPIGVGLANYLSGGL